MKKDIDNIVDDVIDDSTGEVESFKGFRTMWSNPYGIICQDLSNEFEDSYEEIAAFAVDASSGDLINKSSVPVLKKTGKINVHEKIQSFAEEVDLYHILEKFAYSGDTALINARECQYGDISNFPDNLNDYAQMVNKQFSKIKELNPELAEMVIDEKYSSEDIEAKANEILKARLDASKSTDIKESEDKK